MADPDIDPVDPVDPGGPDPSGGQAGADWEQSGSGASLTMLAMGAAVMALVALSLVSAFIGIVSKCNNRKDKFWPILYALGIAFLSFGAWRIRGFLMNASTSLKSLPKVHMGAGGAEMSPELVQTESWIRNWTLMFGLLIGCGYYVIYWNVIEPLQKKCPPDPGSRAAFLTNGLIKLRRQIMWVLLLLVGVPVGYGLYARRSLLQTAAGQLGRGPESIWGGKIGKLNRGGYTAAGSTEVFDNAYNVAELVGYAGGAASAGTAAVGAAAVPAPDHATLNALG